MRSGYEAVTPAEAAGWFAQVREDYDAGLRYNRPFNQRVGDKYLRVMKAGLWDWDSPDGLVWDTDGHLQQGQHRSYAIAQLDGPVKIWVTRGARPESAKHLDRGRPRSVANMLGYEGFQHTNQLAAIARQVVLWEKRKYTQKTFAVAAEESLDAIERHPRLENLARWANSWPSRETVAPSEAGFVLWLFEHVEQSDRAWKFMQALRSGEDLSAGNPVLVLRSRLMADRRTKKQASSPDVRRVGLACLAWRAYTHGDSISKLQLPATVNDAWLRRIVSWRDDYASR